MKFMKYTLTLFVTGLLLLSQAAQAQEMLINTIAGTGVIGFSGDGGTSTNAELYGPQNVTVDNLGNIYFCDFFNLRVRKISTAGVITTVAGNGVSGYSSDTALATTVDMNPQAVVADKLGNIYISDGANVIFKVNSVGVVYRIAGTTMSGYTGDGGLAINARLNGPRGLALDTMGNLYFADAMNNVVRKINTSGVISTIAGDDSAGYFGDDSVATIAKLDSPLSVAVDYSGNVFISDYKNNVIRKVDVNGIMSTYAGVYSLTPGYTGNNGPATAATLNGPGYIAVDTFGNLFIPDANNNVVRKVNAVSGIITTVAGNGTFGFGGDLGNALGANLHVPYGVAVDNSGTLYIADANNERIRKVYNPYLAVKNVYTNADINVYPNPSFGQVTVTGLDQSDKVFIYDMLGRQIGTGWQISNAGSKTFDVASLDAGVYLLQVNDASGSKKAVTRLVKE